MSPGPGTRHTAHFDCVRTAEGGLTLRLSGAWAGQDAVLGEMSAALERLMQGGDGVPVRIVFDGRGLTSWDSRTLVRVMAVGDLARQAGIEVDTTGLPDGMCRLLRLSRAAPARGGRRPPEGPASVSVLVGESTLRLWRDLLDINRFIGESLLSFGRLVRGQAGFLGSDVLRFIQATGPGALPIVGIINVLLGMILAFMGAIQLQQFGAQIYIANLVALGQTREIAPMMTAIVMAGRTGAAYAAQLGTMQVNEEIDALRTFGFSPMDFLVLPRMLALAAMFPLLILYADALGIFGGYLIGVGLLDAGTDEYIEQTRKAIDLGDVLLGVAKGLVFGLIVAVMGCLRGLQSGRSASAVGDAATRAVVSGIIAIIVATAIFDMLSNLLGV